MATRSLRTALTVVGTAVASVLTLTLAGPAAAAPVAPAAARAEGAATAAGFAMYKYPVGQAATGVTCTGIGLNVSSAPDYSRDDCGFANFLISFSFPAMAAWSLTGSYVFYGVCAVISFVLVLRFIEETKGKELEEMQG